MGLPAGPNFFLFSQADYTMNAMLRAGFVSPLFRQVPQTWSMSDPDQLFAMVSEGTARAAATLRAQTPQARQAIRAALRETVATYRVGDHYEVPMPAVLAVGLRPLH